MAKKQDWEKQLAELIEIDGPLVVGMGAGLIDMATAFLAQLPGMAPFAGPSAAVAKTILGAITNTDALLVSAGSQLPSAAMAALAQMGAGNGLPGLPGLVAGGGGGGRDARTETRPAVL